MKSVHTGGGILPFDSFLNRASGGLMAVLKIGDMAPDFELPGVIRERRQKFRLSDYRGNKNVVLAFYALDFSPVCSMQIPAYDKELARYIQLDAQIIGISPDSPYCHIAWQRHEVGWLDFPLLSDFFPHGAVAQAYGVKRENPVPLPGISDRAMFVIDKDGRIAYSSVCELNQVPPTEEIFEVLQRLNESTGARVGS
jgi:peroxiredoxin